MDKNIDAVMKQIDEITKEKSPQDSYDWLCELFDLIEQRLSELAEHPKVSG